MKIQMAGVETITPYKRNPRHNEDAVEKVAASIQQFGFKQPIVVDKARVIIVGHTRLLAALRLGIKQVPILVATDLSPAQVKAYRLADNRVHEESTWDEELLALGDLSKLGFNMEATGFDPDEISALLDQDGAEDEVEQTPNVPENPVTKVGDLIVMGEHRLLCADAKDPKAVQLLLSGCKPGLVYNDPPYGVGIVNSKGVVSTGMAPGFAPRNGGDKAFGKVGTIHSGMKAQPFIKSNVYPEIIGDESTDTAVAAYKICADLKIRAMIFWGGNYYADELPPSSCWIVWDKDNGESFFADAELAWTNLKTSVRLFKHQWNGLLKASERGEKRCHPTQKPVALARWCLEQYGSDAKAVLDMFSGSGSCLMACELLKKSCYAMELSPAYCDVIVTRWQMFTGKTAIRPARAKKARNGRR